MIVSYPIFKYWIKRGAQYDKVFQLEKKIALLLQYIGLAPLKLESSTTFPPPPYIVLSNHTSYLDIVHMYTIIPDFYLFLGKSEILHWPIIKIFFKGMNIPVERGSIRASKKAQELADQKLKSGKCLMIYPEGGIFKGAPRVQKFKNGAFTLAIENNVPIVPVTFLNNWRIMDDSSALWGNSRPGIAKAIVHQSIDTSAMNEKDLISLRNQCKELIEAPLRSRYPQHFQEAAS
jgi:1-acyl-sn-glycerol-3-phosphate acyltransferase